MRWGYEMDVWSMTDLPKGSIVYGGIPGPSAFYTDATILIGSGGSRTTLFQSLQVRPHPTLGYRPTMRAYEVISDIRVPTGSTLNNPALGPGGGAQFYIGNYSKYLAGVSDIELGW